MIIVGFGRFGRIVGRLLYANKIKVTILESDASEVRLLRKYGYKVFMGCYQSGTITRRGC
ncbi:hypothetical protein HND97_01840 [Vibrio cholerae]|nr:hypothetical protein HND97_01840 [Vibrio cholerae]